MRSEAGTNVAERIALFSIVALIVLGLGIGIASMFGDRKVPKGSGEAIREKGDAPPTASALLASLQAERSAGRSAAALRVARELIASHGGTPEAQEATRLLDELEKSVAVAEKEEKEREAKAAAEEEGQRLAAKWSYSADEDPMTSRKARYASIDSENALNFGFPYQGEQHGRLLLREHPSHGRDVMVLISQGQILCPSYEDCTVRVRFDGGAAQRWAASGPADNSTTVIFLRNESGFIQRLRKAKSVRIQIPVYQEGEPLLEFQTGGFSYSRFQKGE